MITRQTYFSWTASNSLPADKDIQDGDELIRLLTKNGKSWATVDASDTYKELVANHLKLLNSLVAPSSAKKKSQSAASKARAARTVKSGRGKRQVKRTRKADTTSFAERMKAAREAKKQTTNDSSVSRARSSKKSASVTKQSSVKTPKVKGPTKADVAAQQYVSAQKSGSVTEDVKQIRKFISLVKKSTKEKLVNAAKNLNKVIAERKITKESPYAANIRGVQQLLIEAATTPPYKIQVSDAHLAELVQIAGGHKIYRSVELLKKFVNWGETQRTAEQSAAFLKSIEKSLPLIKADDPYADEVKLMARLLAKVKAKKTFDLVNTPLSGLAGVLGCLCDSKKGLAGLDDNNDELTDRPVNKAGNVPVAHVHQPASVPVATSVVPTDTHALPVKKRFPAVMSAHEVAAINYPTYQFKNDPETNDWGTLIGQPQNPFAMMISGEPGAGKSTLMMQLAVYLSRNFGPTRYVSSEEYPSLTLADKLERAGGAVRGLTFSKDLSDLSKDIKFLIVDSTNHVKITLSEFLQLRAKYPGMSFILIMQYTKQGQFKGGNEWPHEVDAVFRVVNSPVKGTVVTDKNRFVREPGQILVFKDLD